MALLAGQILLMLVLVYLATTDASFVVEPDYYQKGLHWDAVAAQARQNKQLGWSAKIELGPAVDVRGERTLICKLTDREGRPLDGATIDLVAFSHARGSDRSAVTLMPAGSGRYEAPVRFARQGVWEFRLAIQRGPDTFTYVEQRDVYPPELSEVNLQPEGALSSSSSSSSSCRGRGRGRGRKTKMSSHFFASESFRS